jgi:two-component sensor histidine kinase
MIPTSDYAADRPPPGGRRRAQLVAAYLLAWTVVGLFLFSRDLVRRRYAADPIPWTTLFSAWMVGIFIVAALGPVVLWLGRRFPIEPRVWVRRVALHVVASGVFGFVTLALEAALDWYTSSPPAGATLAGRTARLIVYGFHGNVVLYWIVVGLQSGADYYRRYRAQEREAVELSLKASSLETALVRAQLNALKMQVQPHFLFNTLNAVVALVRQGDRRRAEDTLGRLSELLRLTLSDVDSQEVSLGRELEHLQYYLDIQRVRYQDRLRVIVDAGPAVLDAAMPHLGLQPIVENAVRYAVERRSTPGTIHVSAVREAARLVVRVSDDGPGFGSDQERSAGLGLANVRARLQQLYGREGSLETANRREGGAVVTMTVPFTVVREGAALAASSKGSS